MFIYYYKSFENYFIQNSDNFNQHTYTRFKFLSHVQLKYNSNILSHNSNGAQPLIIPEVGLGDNILFMFKDVNNQNNIEFLVKKIIGCDTSGQLIMESEILETDISTITAIPLVDLFLIKKDGFTNKTLNVNLGNNKILEGSEMKFTKKFVEGDKIIILFQDDVITRRIQKVKNDLQIEITKSILSTKPILGFIPVPAQFVIHNNEGKTNIMVDDNGSLIFASNDSDLDINAIEMSVEKGKMEILSSTVNSTTNQPGIDNYSLDGNFLKLQGNLKIEGQSKFTNDLFICTNQPGLSEPDITALIDSNKGDLRLKGSMVSKRVVANNATMVQLQVNNLLSKTHSTWSDRRLKKDIETVKETNIIEKLSKLNPVKFKWRENETQDMGFIAQEIKEIFPDAVEEHEDGFLHIHYNRLLAYMVMGMKQMNENK